MQYRHYSRECERVDGCQEGDGAPRVGRVRARARAEHAPPVRARLRLPAHAAAAHASRSVGVAFCMKKAALFLACQGGLNDCLSIL